jgi:hypothetical protein
VSESIEARLRRESHERELNRLGVGSPEGQALLERFAAEDRAMRRPVRRVAGDAVAKQPDTGRMSV